MHAIDYLIILTYVAAMLYIGRRCARRNQTQDDFFLGGRKMKSIPVGLSLFVSWFSVISYLAVPGEMIQHGPWLWMGLGAAPLTLYVLGWWVIPKILEYRTTIGLSDFKDMQMTVRGEWHPLLKKLPRITTAYQLLEPIGCQSLASFLFLTLRFAWMAMIVHVASVVLLAPLTGLTGFHASLVSTALVAVTVLYCLGGFRAVVWTDCVQAGVMFAGAIYVLLSVTGVGIAWPTDWLSQWPAPRMDFSPTARVTLPFTLLSAFCLGLCVRSGDQMAVQRYLSTPSISTARRVLFLGFVLDIALTLLLACVGLCLFSLYGAGGDADKLLPRFVSSHLPVGITGIVVAAMLAAAMSSLSSGINACVSSVLMDWKPPVGGPARYKPVSPGVATIAIGVVVLLLSVLIGYVEGNLIEKCYKVVNLLATPLGGLMLMALFFPRVARKGAKVGCAASVATVVWVNYFSGWSFLLASPLGLAVQLSIGFLFQRRKT